MLQTVTIQNFRSLRDVTVHLGKVNLLIGPNNSGKSNFLKALAFVKEHFNGRIYPPFFDLDRIYFQQNTDSLTWMQSPLLFEFTWDFLKAHKTIYHLELYGNDSSSNLIYNELVGLLGGVQPNGWKLFEAIDKWIDNLYDFHVEYARTQSYTLIETENSDLSALISKAEGEWFSFYSNKGKVINKPYPAGQFVDYALAGGKYFPFILSDMFNTIRIYKPDPAKISTENQLLFDKHVNEDCSNLVSFLDNMRDEHPETFTAIEESMNKCIPEFIGIRFEKVKVNDKEALGKRFGLRDKFGKTYWAEELSEGTIYFLALLAIVHQPNPPKILLLEEPEKGIHPRRIVEVVDLIFKLAEENNIQIIMTTHSTQVVDQFEEIPESVFIFDLVDGETKIKNLLTDVIEPDNKQAEKKGYPKLDFSKRKLGEHWAIGFLGGVPTK